MIGGNLYSCTQHFRVELNFYLNYKGINMCDVALTQFVWENVQNVGSEIAMGIWERIKGQIESNIFEKIQQYFTNQQEDEFKQELENILKYNKPLTEQLEQLRQNQNNHVAINVSNVSNITNTHGDINIGVVKL